MWRVFILGPLAVVESFDVPKHAHWLAISALVVPGRERHAGGIDDLLRPVSPNAEHVVRSGGRRATTRSSAFLQTEIRPILVSELGEKVEFAGALQPFAGIEHDDLAFGSRYCRRRSRGEIDPHFR